MRKLFKHPENFLKHADRDPNDLLRYNPDILEIYVLFACNGYLQFTGKMTPEIRIFMIWYSMIHPNILTLSSLRPHLENHIKEFGLPKTKEDKKLFLKLIENTK